MFIFEWIYNLHLLELIDLGSCVKIGESAEYAWLQEVRKCLSMYANKKEFCKIEAGKHVMLFKEYENCWIALKNLNIIGPGQTRNLHRIIIVVEITIRKV